MNELFNILIIIILIIPTALLFVFILMMWEKVEDFIRNIFYSKETVYVMDVGWYWKKIIRSDGYVIYQDTITEEEYNKRRINVVREHKLKRILDENR